MTSPVDLIVGLGNPGADYAATRHNAGVWFVERLAAQLGVSFRQEKKFFGRTAQGSLGGREVRLLLPDTYMNESGRSVAAYVNFYRIPVAHCLIAHDELDFAIGKVRLKRGGGLAGHKGLKDIAACLGSDQSFARLRIGVGHPGDKERVTGHVLGKIRESERALVDDCIEAALDVLPLAAKGEWEAAMNRLHSANPAGASAKTGGN
ncbi:MAG: aminoacyl-tRNA hydrolase [Pseudomonadales bacterium]